VRSEAVIETPAAQEARITLTHEKRGNRTHPIMRTVRRDTNFGRARNGYAARLAELGLIPADIKAIFDKPWTVRPIVLVPTRRAEDDD